MELSHLFSDFGMFAAIIMVACIVIWAYVRNKRSKSDSASEENICPKCGKQLAEDSAFCEYCGTPVAADSEYRIPAKKFYLTMSLIITVLYCAFCMYTDYSYYDYGLYTPITILVLGALAIGALVRFYKRQLHWNDCLFVWLCLGVVSSFNMGVLYALYYHLLPFELGYREQIPFSILLIVIYYLVANAIIKRRNKKNNSAK